MLRALALDPAMLDVSSYYDELHRWTHANPDF